MKGRSYPEREQRSSIAIEQFSGIIPYAEAFYLQSIIYDCERSVTAFTELRVYLLEACSDAVCFALLQQALMHAASISRYFWPQRSKDGLANARATKLRAAFGIADDSPLADRGLRNSLEHYDERLDMFMLEDHFGVLQPWPVIGRIEDDRQGTLHRFKLLDPTQEACVILGERFEYGAIRKAVRSVLARALRFQRNGSRLL